jgi:hypothetical protein
LGWWGQAERAASAISCSSTFIAMMRTADLWEGNNIALGGKLSSHPSAECIAHELTEAYGWQRRRDISLATGIASMAMSFCAVSERWAYAIGPGQNGCAERLIGSIRRDYLDHVVVFGEQHLRHLLNSYQKYYNEARTHLSLHKDAPIPRAVQTVGRTLAVPILGGLHHQYIRTCHVRAACRILRRLVRDCS